MQQECVMPKPNVSMIHHLSAIPVAATADTKALAALAVALVSQYCVHSIALWCTRSDKISLYLENIGRVHEMLTVVARICCANRKDRNTNFYPK